MIVTKTKNAKLSSEIDNSENIFKGPPLHIKPFSLNID